MVQRLLKRVHSTLQAIDMDGALDKVAENILDVYEQAQTEKYVPINPQEFFARIPLGKRRRDFLEHVKHRHSPEGLLLGYFLQKDVPTWEHIEASLLTVPVFNRYNLLISSIVFYIRDVRLYDRFLQHIVKQRLVSSSPQALDYQIFCLSRVTRARTDGTRVEKAKLFKKQMEILLALYDGEDVQSRRKAYDAIAFSFENKMSKATEMAITAAKCSLDFCPQLKPIELFYPPDILFNLSSTIQSEGAHFNSGAPIVLTACDQIYFDHYFEDFYLLSQFSGASLHLHCINFEPQRAYLDKLFAKKGVAISLSTEECETASFGAWCAASRYRILPAILRRTSTVLVTDIDGLLTPLTKDLLANIKPGLYANISQDKNHKNLRYPWNAIFAGNLIICRNDRIWQMTNVVAQLCDTELARRIAAGYHVHYFDQVALISAVRAFDIEVSYIPMFFDWDHVRNNRGFKTHERTS